MVTGSRKNSGVPCAAMPINPGCGTLISETVFSARVSSSKGLMEPCYLLGIIGMKGHVYPRMAGELDIDVNGDKDAQASSVTATKVTRDPTLTSKLPYHFA